MVVPDVELQKIDGCSSNFFEDHVGVLADVIVGEDFTVGIFCGGGPFSILRRNLRGGVETLAGIALDQLAEKAVAVSVAISPGAVEEVATEVNGCLEGLEGLFVVGIFP